MKTIKKLLVQDLKVGHRLNSGATVIEAPFDSVHCPSGKTNIGVEYRNGAKSYRQWNKRTEVAIVIEEPIGLRIDGGDETSLAEFLKDNTSEGELQIESGDITIIRSLEIGEVRILGGGASGTYKAQRIR